MELPFLSGAQGLVQCAVCSSWSSAYRSIATFVVPKLSQGYRLLSRCYIQHTVWAHQAAQYMPFEKRNKFYRCMLYRCMLYRWSSCPGFLYALLGGKRKFHKCKFANFLYTLQTWKRDTYRVAIEQFVVTAILDFEWRYIAVLAHAVVTVTGSEEIRQFLSQKRIS